MGFLSAIIFLPVIGAILIALIPGLSEKAIKWLAAVFTFIPLALAIYLFIIFDRSPGLIGSMQFEENLSWIPAINAFYHVGVDGISLPLVLLMAILGFLVVLISWKVHLRVQGILRLAAAAGDQHPGSLRLSGLAALLPVLGN